MSTISILLMPEGEELNKQDIALNQIMDIINKSDKVLIEPVLLK